jgi:uncharacterized protein YciI
MVDRSQGQGGDWYDSQKIVRFDLLDLTRSTPMSKYVMWGSYCENALEKRTPYRQAHLDGLKAQKESGVLVTLGPTVDNTTVFGIYDADSEEIVKQLIEGDPYWKNQIWTDYTIKEWIQAF